MTEIEPRITSIRYYSGPAPRPKPRAGQLRETKKHGKQVRVLVLARDHSGRAIGRLYNGGKPCYEWLTYVEAEKAGWGHYVPKAML